MTPPNAFRVWVILSEVAEGSWGAEGRIWRFADIVDFVLDDDAHASNTTAAKNQQDRSRSGQRASSLVTTPVRRFG